MTRTLIFDLSEVLIAGLLGIEQPLAERLGVPAEAVLRALGEGLQELCCGQLSEDDYLAQILRRHGWSIAPDELKALIRQNFHQPVAGMDRVLARLAQRYELVLLSDHAVEWIGYIRGVHGFLGQFRALFFSYELGQTKRDPRTFERVLAALGRAPEECLFIDDNAGNIAAAASIGLPGIRFTTAPELVEALCARGLLRPGEVG